MELPKPGAPQPPLSIKWNLDCSAFSVASHLGFKVMDSDPFNVRTERFFGQGVGICESLYRSNIAALVGGGSDPVFPKNKVMIWDDAQEKSVAELSFRTSVVDVKLRRDTITVVLADRTLVYDFATLKLLDQITTPVASQRSCAVSGGLSMMLACPGPRQGEILFKSYSQGNTGVPIHCHANNISCVTMNYDGTRFATASDRGTLVRIFDTRIGREPLKTVRRGTNPANIQSLALNRLGTELAVASDTGTIHLFSCEEGASNYNASSGLWVLGSPEETSGYRWNAKETAANIAFTREPHTLLVVGSTIGCYKYTYGDQFTENQLTLPETFIPRN